MSMKVTEQPEQTVKRGWLESERGGDVDYNNRVESEVCQVRRSLGDYLQ
jgi:hypothetical protein